MTLHDPERVVANLRDHLARHDKPIAFFFGAGTSCAAGTSDGDDWTPFIPAVPGLTKTCKEKATEQNEKFGTAWDQVETHCLDDGQDKYVESVLSRLRMMLRAMGADDELCGLSRAEISDLEASIRKSIVEVVAPPLTPPPAVFPHLEFARWVARAARSSPIEIYTVNYDLLVEHALENERVPVFDGFAGSSRPYFQVESLTRRDHAPGPAWTRVWKMHGSVNWRRETIGEHQRIVRGDISMEGELIFPSFDKYDESRQQPYSAFTARLRSFLEQDDALLVVAGYSFSDEHINDIIFGALESSARTHVYALQYDDAPDNHELIRRAKQRRNLIVLGPTAGIISGRVGKWDCEAELGVCEPVVDTTAGDDSRRMCIGDFARFAKFLAGMAEG